MQLNLIPKCCDLYIINCTLQCFPLNVTKAQILHSRLRWMVTIFSGDISNLTNQINQSINVSSINITCNPISNQPPYLIYLTGFKYKNMFKTYLLFDFLIHFIILMSADYVNKEISGNVKAKVDFVFLLTINKFLLCNL